MLLAVGVLTMTSCKPRIVTPTLPSVQSRRSGPWRDNASVISTGPYTIYYYGTAAPPAPATGAAWSGTITGDIFLVAPDAYMMVPNGTLSIGPKGEVSTTGASTSGIIDQPKKP
jgi:hypothetical protein